MTTDQPEPTATLPQVEETEAVPDSLPVLTIEEGFVTKRGPRPLRLWQKRYFRLPAENHAYPLHKLRLVYRKNVKKMQAPKEEFEKTNSYLLQTLATSTVNSNYILSYFKSEDKNELPQGLINLKQVKDIEHSPKIKPFAFTIKTQTRDYVFSTNSQKDTDAWVETLKRLAASELSDFSETAAYKFSYSQLAERKGFASPSAPAQDDEVFSASEGEYEPKEANAEPTGESSDPAAVAVVPLPGVEAAVAKSEEDKSVDADKHEAGIDAASPRKSFYNEVIDFFYRKTPDGEPIKEADESTSAEPRAEPKPEVKAETETEGQQEPAQPAVAKPEEETARASEFSQEIADMVAPITSDPPALDAVPVAPQAEAASPETRPARSKTFVMPKFEGKIFSKFFKKGATDEAQHKEPEVADLPKEDVKENISAAESVPEPATTEAAETTNETTEVPPVISPVELLPEPTSEVKAEEVSESPESKVVEEHEEAKEEVAPVAAVPESSSVETTEPAVKEVAESEPEVVAAVVAPVPETSNEEASNVEAAAVEAPQPPVSGASHKEEKRPFLTRFLSGGGKNKNEPASPEPVHAELSENKEVQATEEVAAAASSPVVEAKSEPSSPVIEEKRPFIKRLLSGKSKKAADGVVVADVPAEETHIDNVVAEASAIEAPKVEEVVATEEPAEIAPLEVKEVTEEPAEASESAAEVIPKSVESEETPKTEDSDASAKPPAPGRQASLITRIGEFAYSAVAPATSTIAEEGAEVISEHYIEKAKDAAMSGFLFKQSTLLHTNNLRYVILSKDGTFTYYRSSQVPSEGKKVVIDETVEVGPVEELLLSIKPATGAALNFQAKTREDRDAWGAALSKFAKAVPVVEAEPETKADEPAVDATPVVETSDAVEAKDAESEKAVETKESVEVAASSKPESVTAEASTPAPAPTSETKADA